MSHLRAFWITLCLLLIALALRTYNLDLRTFWFDEGITLTYAPLTYLSNARLAVELVDMNPFVYRRTTGIWSYLVGSSIWSIRLVSAFASTLLIAVTARLALDLTKRHAAAVMTTLLITISPMLIYYAQEAKGYSLIALAATTLLLVLNRIYQRIQARQSVPWGYWGIATIAIITGMGSHYIFAFFLITLNSAAILYFLLQRKTETWQFIWKFVVAQAIGALFLLPFVLITFGGVSEAAANDQVDQNNLNTAAAFFGRHAVDFTQGPFSGLPADCVPHPHDMRCGFEPQPSWWLNVGLFALVLAGVWMGARQLKWQRWTALALVTAPVLLGYAFTQFNTFFFPRFVMYTLPLLLTLFGAGLYWLSQRSRLLTGLILAAFVAISIGPTRRLYATSTPADVDWRPIAEQVAPFIEDGDGAVHVWVWVPGYFYSYLPENKIDYKLAHFTPETRLTELTDFSADKSKIWLFDWITGPRDPINDNARWLLENTAFVYETSYTDAYANLFVPPHAVDNTGDPTMVSFTNGISLTYNALEATKSAGTPLALALNWTTTGVDIPYKVFLHITAPDGFVLAQQDSEPLNGLRPFNTWQGDLTEWRGTMLPLELSAGSYNVNIGIYDPNTGERVLVEGGGDFVQVGTLNIPAN